MFVEREPNSVKETMCLLIFGTPTVPSSSSGVAAALSKSQRRNQMQSVGWDFQRRVNRVREFVPESPHDALAKKKELAQVLFDFEKHVKGVAKYFIQQRLEQGVWSIDDNDAPTLKVNRLRINLSGEDDSLSRSVKSVILHCVEGEAVELLNDGIRYTLVNHPSNVVMHDRSQELCMKAANAEITGRSTMLAVEPLRQVIHTPLACTLNYAGWSVFATCDLELSSATAVGGVYRTFGDQIGRRPPVTETPVASKAYDHFQRVLATHLALKPHSIGGVTTGINVDAQLHLATDGKYYACALKRLMPPTIAPPAGPVPHHLDPSINESVAHRFRPEFLALYVPTAPLSSDAWMHLKNRAADAADIDILQSSRTLLGKACEQLAYRLLQFHDQRVNCGKSAGHSGAAGEGASAPLSKSPSATTLRRIGSFTLGGGDNAAGGGGADEYLLVDVPEVAFATLDTKKLKVLFHAYGVNLRYMGRVTKLVEDEMIRRNEQAAIRAASLNQFKPRDRGASSSKQAAPLSPITSRSNIFTSAADRQQAEADAAEKRRALQSPVLDCLRIEMAARASRDVLQREWRRIAADFAVSLESGGTVNLGGKTLPAASLRLDDVLEERTLDWLMRVSGDGLSHLDGSDQRIWESQIIPRIKEKFDYDYIFKRKAAEGDSTAALTLGGAPPPRLALNRIKVRLQGDAADDVALTAMRNQALSSNELIARALAHRIALPEPRSLSDVVPRPVPISATGFTNWATLNDAHMVSRPSALVQIGADVQSLRSQERAIAQASAAAAAATDGGEGSAGLDATSNNHSFLSSTGRPGRLTSLDSTFSSVTGGGATASFMSEPPLPIGSGGVSVAAVMDFCRPSDWDQFAVRLGSMQDWRLVDRICTLGGVTLFSSRRSVLGYWCTVEAAAKSLQPTNSDLAYLQQVLDGDTSGAEAITSAEIKRRRKLLMQTTNGGTADVICLDLYRRLVEVHRFCGRTTQVMACLKKVREVLAYDANSHELGIIPCLLEESGLELRRRGISEALDLATNALTMADMATKGSLQVVNAIAMLLDALDAQGHSDPATKRRKESLVTRMSRLSAQLCSPTAKIAAREAVMHAVKQYGALSWQTYSTTESSRSSKRNSRRGSNLSRRSSDASGTFDQDAGGDSFDTGRQSPNSGDEELFDNAADLRQSGDAIPAIESDPALMPLLTSVRRLIDERGLTDSDSILYFMIWACYRFVSVAKHSFAQGSAGWVDRMQELATASRALTHFVSPTNGAYSIAITSLCCAVYAKLKALSLCDTALSEIAFHPDLRAKIADALDGHEFKDLVSLTALALRGYARNVVASVPKPQLYFPWHWDVQLTGAATHLMQTVHALSECCYIGAPIAAVVGETITSLTGALAASTAAAYATMFPGDGGGLPLLPPLAIPFYVDRSSCLMTLCLTAPRESKLAKELNAFSAFSDEPTLTLPPATADAGMAVDRHTKTGVSFVASGPTPGSTAAGVTPEPLMGGDAAGSSTTMPALPPLTLQDVDVVVNAPGVGSPGFVSPADHAPMHGHPLEPFVACDLWLQTVRSLIAIAAEYGTTRPLFPIVVPAPEVPPSPAELQAAEAARRRKGTTAAAAPAPAQRFVTLDTLQPPREVAVVVTEGSWRENEDTRSLLTRLILAREGSPSLTLLPRIDLFKEHALLALERSVAAAVEAMPSCKMPLWNRVLDLYTQLHLIEAWVSELPVPSDTPEPDVATRLGDGSDIQLRLPVEAIAPRDPSVPMRERTVADLERVVTTLQRMTDLGRRALGAMKGQTSYERILAAAQMNLVEARERFEQEAARRSAMLAERNAASGGVGGGANRNRRKSLAPVAFRGTSSSPTPGAPSSGAAGHSGSKDGAHAASKSVGLQRPQRTTSPTLATAAVKGSSERKPGQHAPPPAHPEGVLTVSKSVIPAGTTIDVTWELPKMVPPRYAWIGIFPGTGPMNVQTAITRFEGFAVRQPKGCETNVLLPPTAGEYRVAYFTALHSTATPFSDAMVAKVHVVLPRVPPLTGYVQPVKRAFAKSPNLLKPDEPVQTETVQPEWIPHDTKRSLVERMQGRIQRIEAEHSRDALRSPSPPRSRLSNLAPLPAKASTPPPTTTTAKPKVEYVCVAQYLDKEAQERKYRRTLATTGHKERTLLGEDRVINLTGDLGFSMF